MRRSALHAVAEVPFSTRGCLNTRGEPGTHVLHISSNDNRLVGDKGYSPYECSKRRQGRVGVAVEGLSISCPADSSGSSSPLRSSSLSSAIESKTTISSTSATQNASSGKTSRRRSDGDSSARNQHVGKGVLSSSGNGGDTLTGTATECVSSPASYAEGTHRWEIVGFQVSIQSKVNELFLRWLSRETTQKDLQAFLNRMRQTDTSPVPTELPRPASEGQSVDTQSSHIGPGVVTKPSVCTLRSIQLPFSSSTSQKPAGLNEPKAPTREVADEESESYRADDAKADDRLSTAPVDRASHEGSSSRQLTRHVSGQNTLSIATRRERAEAPSVEQSVSNLITKFSDRVHRASPSPKHSAPAESPSTARTPRREPDIRASFDARSTPGSQLAVSTRVTPRSTPRPDAPVGPMRKSEVPAFYFPYGQAPGDLVLRDEMRLLAVRSIFDRKENVAFSDFPEIMRALGLPLYWKSALFRAANPQRKLTITYEGLATVWTRLVHKYHDPASRLFHLLSCHRKLDYLEPCDWESLIKDVVNTHPGLKFLKEAKDFISRYCKTVIARIYFIANRSLSDRLSLSELRRSNLVEVLANLEIEDDINKFKDYFSYEHFYVIYCKFWEIDRDHDLFISQDDLYQHNQNAISRRVIDRIFAGAVSNSAEIKKGLMSYYEFVWFLIAEEDKRSRSSIEYWFRCLDMDGDGSLSMYELEYFYEEQMQRMEMYGYEFMQFEDVMCQMIDMLKPVDKTKIRLMDLKKCKLVNVFFDTFINVEKHLEHEQRDPFANFKEVDTIDVCDWVRYAAEEYENLMMEEQMQSNSDDMPVDEEYNDICEDNGVRESAASDAQQSSALDQNDISSASRKTAQLVNTTNL